MLDDLHSSLLRPLRSFAAIKNMRPAFRGWAFCSVLLAVGWAVAQEPPPDPVEAGISPPEFPREVAGTNEMGGVFLGEPFATNPPPSVVYVTNTVYVIPSNTVIRIQVRDSLDSGDWFEPVVFKSRTSYKFFRVLFETEALK